MDAGKKILLDLLTGSLRFAVPVYQRRDSWGEAQCCQRMEHTPSPVDMSRLMTPYKQRTDHRAMAGHDPKCTTFRVLPLSLVSLLNC